MFVGHFTGSVSDQAELAFCRTWPQQAEHGVAIYCPDDSATEAGDEYLCASRLGHRTNMIGSRRTTLGGVEQERSFAVGGRNFCQLAGINCVTHPNSVAKPKCKSSPRA